MLCMACPLSRGVPLTANPSPLRVRMVVHPSCRAGEMDCGGGVPQFSVAFGVVQLLFSQMPSLESAWWSSAVGAAMSVMYSCAALSMGAARGARRGRAVRRRAHRMPRLR